MKWIEKLTGNYSPSARVVDGTLIISLPQAVTPVVWRMELGHARSAALEIRAQENGHHVLTLKTPKGDVYDIAPFQNRGPALDALMCISSAMQQSHGQIRTMVPEQQNNPGPATTASDKKAAGRSRFPLALVGTILLVGLIIVLVNMGPRNPAHTPDSSQTAAISGQAGSAPVGVPMSADDFLNNR